MREKGCDGDDDDDDALRCLYDCHLCGVHIDMQIHVIASALSIIVLLFFCENKLHFGLII